MTSAYPIVPSVFVTISFFATSYFSSYDSDPHLCSHSPQAGGSVPSPFVSKPGPAFSFSSGLEGMKSSAHLTIQSCQSQKLA